MMAAADQARSLVQKWLGDYLVTAVHTNEEVILNHASRFLPLPGGAITTGPATVTEGTTTVTGSAANGFTVERFGLRRKFGYTWASGVKITATYTVGWADGSEPTEIKEAITLLTAWYGTAPATSATNVAEIEIGNARVKTGASVGAGPDGQIHPPGHVRDLLVGWAIRNVG